MEQDKHSIIAPDDLPPEEMAELLEARVTEVFDGDGFLAELWHPGRREWIRRVPFRLAFIDAPELQQSLGPESKEFLDRLIGGKDLRLAPIVKESTPWRPVDQYKRMLCMAFLIEEMPTGETSYFKDGECGVGNVKRARLVTRNVELELVVNGWAWVTEQYAFDREEEYFVAQENARDHRRGIWALESPEPPWQFKQRQKRQRNAATNQPTLFAEPCEVGGCDGVLIERTGARGSFLGCSNFPRCRFSRNT